MKELLRNQLRDRRLNLNLWEGDLGLAIPPTNIVKTYNYYRRSITSSNGSRACNGAKKRVLIGCQLCMLCFLNVPKSST